MCGLTGFLDLSVQTEGDELRSLAARMADTLKHRGPDDSGTWVDKNSGIALGYRRLAILDLTQEGHQPMHSACGRYVIAFNGEVYNFLALRQELEALGQSYRGHSDTEVMLAAISRWGLQAAVQRFDGMFAFAVWDRQAHRLHLVRDRLGEKPLYYGWMGKTFLFGSELKALRVHPDFKGEVNRDVLALYLRFAYVPAPFSIYKGIYKLPPGCMLSVAPESGGESGSFSPYPTLGPQTSSLTPTRYWSAKQVAERGVREPFTGSEDDAVAHLDSLLRETIKLRMIADVPLGALLSGGIDSSTVVALMQAQSSRAVKTFTIGFYEAEYDEAKQAAAVARHLGTEHTELYLTPEQAVAVIPRLPSLYDEPFADVSQIPTYLVSQLARRYVTVGLSGDGGDEVFGGYRRYVWGPAIWKKVGWMPKGVRAAAAKALSTLSPQAWGTLFRKMGPVLPKKLRQRNPPDSLHKLAEMVAVDDLEQAYLGLASLWKAPTSLAIGANEPPTMLTHRGEWANLQDFVQQMMYLDTVTYLPDDILVKLDRASMGVSLEGRVPYLGHRVVEFAWQLPLSMKIRNGAGKWILRRVLYRYVPPELVERPKMGFNVPIDTWLRGPLRDWAETLLDERRLRQEGFLNPAPIREKWAQHVSGRRNWQHNLWVILMFESWLDENRA